MAGETVVAKGGWDFPQADDKEIRGRTFYGEVGKPTLASGPGLRDWNIRVNWIDATPYFSGYPGKQKYPAKPLDVGASVWGTQVGGDHYTKMKIQPFEFTMANNLDPMQHTIIKYVCRFRSKNGIQDLEKAKQTIDLLIQWEKDHATAK